MIHDWMHAVGISRLVTLAHPAYLWFLLLLVPAWRWSRRAPGRVAYTSLAILPAATSSWRSRTVWVPAALLTAAMACLVVALAGPQRANQDSRISAEGIAIMMIVDVSSSMRALDLSTKEAEQTRLDAVKQVFSRFVAGGDGLSGRSSDLIGLVSFAGYADTRSPLTLDHDNLLAALDATQLVVPGSEEDGTAIGDALALGLERLRHSSVVSNVVILLTDGENNAGEQDPLQTARVAREMGVRVYTIGAGTNGFARVRDGRPQPVRIDEALLRQMAETTGGQYFRATDQAGLRAITQRIDALERSQIEEVRYAEHKPYAPHFVAAAACLWLLGLIGRFSLWRRLPE